MAQTGETREQDVPVETIEPPVVVLQHIDLEWAEASMAWKLVRSDHDQCSVVTYHSGMSCYTNLHGPFSIAEIVAGLTKVSNAEVLDDTVDRDYFDLDEMEGDNTFGFTDWNAEDSGRIMYRSSDNEVTIVAECGDAYVFLLDRLRAAVKRVADLAVVPVETEDE